MSDELLKKVEERSIRWLRDNFFNGEFATESAFSVRELIEQSSKKEILNKHINSLVEAGKEKRLDDTLRNNPEEKRNSLLFFDCDEYSNKDKAISSFKNPCFSILGVFYLSDEVDKIIEIMEQHRGLDSLEIFIMASNDALNSSDTKAKLTYMIGLVGKKKVTVLYKENNETFFAFAKTVGINYDVEPFD